MMKPLTRLEHFLAKIAGDVNAKNLAPLTRKEYYLNKIAEANDAKQGLPEVKVADAGKVLVVGADGEWEVGDVPVQTPTQTPGG